MPRKGILLLFPLLLALACSKQPSALPVADSEDTTQSPATKDKASPTTWPKDWTAHLGKVVTVEGKAVNMKVGAALFGDGEAIFVDGIDFWPDGYYLGEERGKRLRVTGTVIDRHDLPVFIPKEGELPKAGIPVPEGTDLHKASRRFLIQNAKWVVVE